MYVDANGNVCVVECKGGDSPLGSRNLTAKESGGGRAMQGTEEYMDDIIENMRAEIKAERTEHLKLNGNISNPKLDALEDTLKKIDAASESGKLKYLYARQKMDATTGGMKGNLIVKDFLN